MGIFYIYAMHKIRYDCMVIQNPNLRHSCACVQSLLILTWRFGVISFSEINEYIKYKNLCMPKLAP